ncbi:MAG: leucine-rich repeat protein [Clostridia bacterium]|nr:leucine-rich repeat protein [Clostridia bacterium]
MAFVEAKCTQCGGNIKVDDTKEAGICAHCGTAFITEKAINNYITTNNITHNHIQNTNINANTVNVFQDELNKFFVVEQGTLIKYNGKLKKITIPEGIVAIGEDVFVNKEYNEIILPKSVEVISKNAFNTSTVDIDYTNYSPKVIVPEDGNLKEIEDNAFYDNVTIVPRSVEKLGKVDGMIFYYGTEEEFKHKFPNHTNTEDWKKKVVCNFKNLGEKDNFYYGESDTEVYIYDTKKTGNPTLTVFSQINGKKVTSINYGTFKKLVTNEHGSYEAGITEVIFEEGLTEIGSFIWGVDTSNFKYMYIPSTIQSIGNRAIIGFDLDLVEIATNIKIKDSVFYKTENPSLFVRKLDNSKGPKQNTFIVDNQTSKDVVVERYAMFGFYKKNYKVCVVKANTQKEIYITPSGMGLVCNGYINELKDLTGGSYYEVKNVKGATIVKNKGSSVCRIRPTNFKNKTMYIFAKGEKRMINSHGFAFEYYKDKDDVVIIKSKKYKLPEKGCIVHIKKKFLGVDVTIKEEEF